MSKRCFRFFGGLLTAQARWLNRMAARGYRLEKTTRAVYEFTECEPDRYRYAVEFVADRSKSDADDYADFLRGCGYRVFFKNINLDYSFGKVKLRPWAQKGGRLATDRGTLHRELLIVEKINDGRPFELHTTLEDKKRYCRVRATPWMYLFAVSAALAAAMKSAVWAVFGALSLAVLVVFSVEFLKMKQESEFRE